MLIVVLGRAGSGKTTAAKKVSELTELPLLEMSDFLKRASGAKDKRSNWRQLHTEMYKHQDRDPDWLWRRVHEALLDHSGNCVLSGIREPYLLHKAITEFPDVLVISIETSEFHRYSRMCGRDGYISIKHFRERNDGDNEMGIDITLSRSNVVVNGDKPLNQVFKELEKAIYARRLLK